MNKRDAVLNLVHGVAPSEYTPAAFFMHFDSAHHSGQAAIDKHLEYFHATGMDFVKIQFEQRMPLTSHRHGLGLGPDSALRRIVF